MAKDNAGVALILLACALPGAGTGTKQDERRSSPLLAQRANVAPRYCQSHCCSYSYKQGDDTIAASSRLLASAFPSVLQMYKRNKGLLGLFCVFLFRLIPNRRGATAFFVFFFHRVFTALLFAFPPPLRFFA